MRTAAGNLAPRRGNRLKLLWAAGALAAAGCTSATHPVTDPTKPGTYVVSDVGRVVGIDGNNSRYTLVETCSYQTTPNPPVLPYNFTNAAYEAVATPSNTIYKRLQVTSTKSKPANSNEATSTITGGDTQTVSQDQMMADLHKSADLRNFPLPTGVFPAADNIAGVVCGVDVLSEARVASSDPQHPTMGSLAAGTYVQVTLQDKRSVADVHGNLFPVVTYAGSFPIAHDPVLITSTK